MATNRFFEDEQLNYKFNAKALKKTLGFAVPYKKTILIVMPLMLLVSLLLMMPPFINKFLIDNVIVNNEGLWGMDYKSTAIVLVSTLIFVAISEVSFAYFRILFMSKVGHGMVYDIRYNAFCNLQKLAFDFYDSRPAGKILVRLTNYLDELANIFSSSVVNLIIESTKVVMIVVWLFLLNAYLACIVVAVIIPMGIIIFFLRKKVASRYRVVRNKASNRTAYIAENVQGTTVTKLFNREEQNTQIYESLCQEAADEFIGAIRIENFFWPVLDGFFYLALMAVYVGAVLFTSRNMAAITAGDIIGFIGYMGMIASPLHIIAMAAQQLTNASTNLERVFEVAQTPASVFDKPTAYELPKIKGDVQFDNVTFGYDKHNIILQNFNLSVPSGRMIALVGPTGAGKSTVINLLPRFYDISQGSIQIDGHNIADVSLYSLRSQIGVMMQDSFIFSGTILQNIRYARPDASEQECIEAAKSVYAHEFISKLPNGYHTKTLEGGQGLSSGEKQLLCLARVVLSDPKILILDEATSNIDSATESLIKDALDVVLKNRTSFIVAHRLSTIKKADCILYIKDKGIQEAGTHQQLMAAKGSYYALVEGQINKSKTA